MDNYSDLEIQQILQKALEHRSGDNLSRSQVEEIARELGVSAEEFAAAEAEWRDEILRDRDRAEFIRLNRRKFRDGLVTYGLVNGGLMGINFLVVQAITWSLYPLLGWGVFLLLEGWSVLATDSHKFERKFQAWLTQKQQERRREQFRQKLASAANEVTDKVTRTAVSFTDKFADKLTKKVEKWLDKK